MSIKRTAIVALAAASAIVGAAATANAGGRHFHGFHRHHFHGHGLHLRIGPVYRDCSFYREMWEDTGSLKWKRRYFSCRGWW